MFDKTLMLLLLLQIVTNGHSQPPPEIDTLSDFFIQEFFNTTKYPRIELTAAQASWFCSLRNMKSESHTPNVKRHNVRSAHGIPLRKEYRQLTVKERRDLHQALRIMKQSFPGDDGVSEYDLFVLLHRAANSPSAHQGGAFLPWHREFLLTFEHALQTHVPGVMIPYYDSQLDNRLPNPLDSAIWTPKFLGNKGGPVTTGFTTDVAGGWTAPTGCRHLGSVLSRSPLANRPLFNEEDVNFVKSARDFIDIVWPSNRRFEGAHNRVHVFVGGHMGVAPCAPLDPIFWMHHGYIDCLWEEFRQESQVRDPELDYPNPANAVTIGGEGHRPNSPMSPFMGLSNIDGLSNDYTSTQYSCAPRPSSITCDCSYDCGSLSLFCDLSDNQCKAKIKTGGDCSGFADYDPCDSAECPVTIKAICSSNSICECDGN